jgi:hypothetical protein
MTGQGYQAPLGLSFRHGIFIMRFYHAFSACLHAEVMRYFRSAERRHTFERGLCATRSLVAFAVRWSQSVAHALLQRDVVHY